MFFFPKCFFKDSLVELSPHFVSTTIFLPRPEQAAPVPWVPSILDRQTVARDQRSLTFYSKLLAPFSSSSSLGFQRPSFPRCIANPLATYLLLLPSLLHYCLALAGFVLATGKTRMSSITQMVRLQSLLWP